MAQRAAALLAVELAVTRTLERGQVHGTTAEQAPAQRGGEVGRPGLAGGRAVLR
ncbi:hypothetical protein M3673_14030 [Nocardioides sp. P86]|nr:hypothetical protein [Nocardioides sp. P86]